MLLLAARGMDEYNLQRPAVDERDHDTAECDAPWLSK